MNWLTKLERKFGRYYIPNLISILVGGQIVVYAVELFVNRYITYSLTLTRPALFAGEIWRDLAAGDLFVRPLQLGQHPELCPGGLFCMVPGVGAGSRLGGLPFQRICPSGDAGGMS